MSTLSRILEPEVMDTVLDASEYDAMDHSDVNRIFVQDFLEACEKYNVRLINDTLDVGTGTALIPIELCRSIPEIRVKGIDLATEMLKLAKKNISLSGMTERVCVEHVDAKGLPYNSSSFRAVISNSIIHHIPVPLECLNEACRVLTAGGILFIRDLARPLNQQHLLELVELHAGHESEYSRQLFRQSLEAALTVNEVEQMINQINQHTEKLKVCELKMTSNRHWTLIAIKLHS